MNLDPNKADVEITFKADSTGDATMELSQHFDAKQFIMAVRSGQPDVLLATVSRDSTVSAYGVINICEAPHLEANDEFYFMVRADEIYSYTVTGRSVHSLQQEAETAALRERLVY